MYGIRKGVSAANPIAKATALDDAADFPNPRLFFMIYSIVVISSDYVGYCCGILI